jgi:two-component system response regulator DctR
MAISNAVVHIIDDDDELRRSLSWMLSKLEFDAHCYESAEAYFEADIEDDPGCVLLDVRLGGMSGMKLLERVMDGEYRPPVIMMTAYADVPTAVRAVQLGAYDFIEKPFTRNQLIERLSGAVACDARQRCRHKMVRDVRKRWESLTQRERDVITRVITGKINKEIAKELCLSRRTVESHRANAMNKLNIHSAPKLALHAAWAGLDIACLSDLDSEAAPSCANPDFRNTLFDCVKTMRSELSAEANHRVRNNLQSMQSMIGLIANRSDSVQAFKDQLADRIWLMSHAHTALSACAWSYMDLNEVVQTVLEASMSHGVSGVRCEHSQSPIMVAPRQIVPLVMALGELLLHIGTWRDSAPTEDGEVLNITQKRSGADDIRARIELRQTVVDEREHACFEAMLQELLAGYVEHELHGNIEFSRENDARVLAFEFSACDMENCEIPWTALSVDSGTTIRENAR